ncbi:aminotransferase class IV [Streptomyces sp. G45]|uniref:aminotransferase class IV n=1 Tax=Streptomyces sp. G45 TaxID=3406627 RepID=UPI003C17D17E
MSAHTFWDGPYDGRCGPGRGIPFGSSSVQHGSAVFEGIRAYASTTGEPHLFRLDDHLIRLLGSARELGIRHAYDLDRLRELVIEATAASGLHDCYVRPGLFAADPVLSIDVGRLPFTLGVEVWPMAAPGAAARGPGVRLTVSPWCRPSPSSFPPRVKAVGTYVTSALAKSAAVAAGYDDALQLDPGSGRVAEATVSNVFLVRDCALHTPWLCDSLLAGITRDTVLTLARELGLAVYQGPVETEDVRAADEVFLTGTASELVPVAALDEHAYAAERPVFDTLATAFRNATTGARFTHPGWLTPVHATARTTTHQGA